MQGNVLKATRQVGSEFIRTAGKVAGSLSILGVLGVVAGILWDNLWVLGIGVGLVGGTVAVNRQMAINDLMASASRVRFVFIGSHNANLRAAFTFYEKKSGTKLGEQEQFYPDTWVLFYITEVSNDPPSHSPEAIVTDALPEIAVFEEGQDEPIVERIGRWTGNPQLIDLPAGTDLDQARRRTLPPNGERHRIDVLLRNPNDEGFYVASNEIWQITSRSQTEPPGLRDSQAYLKPAKYRVRVRIIGTGMKPQIGWFLFDGMSDPPTWKSENQEESA